jgi:NitT/TauT family transport system permease protein/sulfonate transport system permease protein
MTRTHLPYLLSLLVGVALWELVARQFSGFILAPPAAVLAQLGQLSLSLELPMLLGRSLLHMIIGFAFATAIAIPVGLAMGRNRVVFELLDPIVNAFYAVPIVAFVPFLIVWFGLYFEARVALVFLMCVFDMIIVVAAGARDVGTNLIDVGRAFGAGSWQTTRLVLVPACLPFLFAALRIGVIRAVNGMITAELFFAAVNLGAFMKSASSRFDSAALLAALVVLCLFGLVLQEALKWLEARVLPWHIRS